MAKPSEVRRLALFIERVSYRLNRAELERCVDEVRAVGLCLDGSERQADGYSDGLARDILEPEP